jgi:arabinose-5-phosphate isomerase
VETNLKYIDDAKKVIATEIESIKGLMDKINNGFCHSVDKILHCEGKVVISGVGKSGIIGKKIAATFASVGTPSFFVHPGEAYHGDLGMVESRDIALLISNSGESDEILKLLPFFKSNNNCVIGMVGNLDSTLGRFSNFVIDIGVPKEACPLELAPTASTTATLVMGDALALTLMKARGFKEENYARFHPGGSLGRRLLTKVKDVMRDHSGMCVTADTHIRDVISAISRGRCGLAVILNEDHSVRGVVTDGDIRRGMEEFGEKFLMITAQDIMTDSPKTIEANTMIVDAEQTMRLKRISSLLVVDQGKFSGVLELYDD